MHFFLLKLLRITQLKFFRKSLKVSPKQKKTVFNLKINTSASWKNQPLLFFNKTICSVIEHVNMIRNLIGAKPPENQTLIKTNLNRGQPFQPLRKVYPEVFPALINRVKTFHALQLLLPLIPSKNIYFIIQINCRTIEPLLIQAGGLPPAQQIHVKPLHTVKH